MPDVKALFFDVFGTLVDWRTSIARETEALLWPLGYSIDWLAFADAWRGEYQPAMAEIREGRASFCKLDVLHRKNLERICRASPLNPFRRTCLPISISPGIASTAGRTPLLGSCASSVTS